MNRDYFPASLNVKGRRCLVVGDDREALEKTERLKKAGALVSRKPLSRFKLKDIGNQFFIVFCPKDQPKMVKAVFKACRSKKTLLCAIDQPDYCDVVNVSVFERGDLKVMISTNGVAPALARKIRQGLENSLAHVPIESFMKELSALRSRLNKTVKDASLRREKLIAAVDQVAFMANLKLPNE